MRDKWGYVSDWFWDWMVGRRGNADGRSPGFRRMESGYQGFFGERSAGSLKIKQEVCSELIKLAR